MSATDLFLREVILDIDTLRITCGQGVGLDCDFDVLKSWTTEANSSTIKVYNLNVDHRAALAAKAKKAKVRVRLEAGYVDARAVLYSGDFDRVDTRREGPDVITELTCRDGAVVMASNALSRSYVKDTQVDTVLRDLAKACEFDVGNLADVLADAQIAGAGRVFRYPVAVNGNAWAALCKLAASAGLEVSLQNGILQFLRVGGGLKNTAVVLKSTTGLVGSPTVAASQGQNILRCQALIQPGLDPGRQIRVEGEFVQGNYTIRRVKFAGSTWGTDWHANIEARPV